MKSIFNKLPSKTLCGKFLTVYIPMMLLALLIVFMVFAVIDYNESNTNFNDRINFLLDINKNNLAEAINNKNRKWQDSIISQIIQDPNVVAVQVVNNKDKTILNGYEKLSKYNSKNLLSKESQIFYQNNYLGTIRIVASPSYHMQQLKQRLFTDFYLSLFAVLVVTLSALIVNRYLIYLPLNKMLQAIELTNNTGKNQTVDWNSNDEIGKVVAAFNEMQLQLQQKSDTLILSKEQAIAGSKSKSEFLANISHELRTPLHVIIGVTKMTIKSVNSWSKEKTRDALQDVLNSSERLLILVDELLDISKLESGKMNFEFGHHNLLNVTEWVLNELDPLILEKHISLSLECRKQESLSGVFDYSKIGQVIRNLLSNAIKFTPAHGEIRIELSSEFNNLKFVITDNGIGIPPNELDLIFEKFAQSSKTKTGAGGTGLGLAICKEVIELHDGSIYAVNNPENGVTITFTIPKEQR
jgi:signal transduction histidine kinase